MVIILCWQTSNTYTRHTTRYPKRIRTKEHKAQPFYHDLTNRVVRIPVKIRSESNDPGTICRSWCFLAILLIVTLSTAGCMLIEPDETSTPVTTLSETLPATEITAVQTAPPTQVPAAVSTTLPVKNITITRPMKLELYTRIQESEEVTASVNSFSDPRTRDRVGAYLRWDSTRARTNRTETARIEQIVKNIDTAIRFSRLEEDLVLYAGITGDVPLKIINTSRYSEDSYLLCSVDPSVVYHVMDSTGRDREGFVSLLVIPRKQGNYLLYVNDTNREILLPRLTTWELQREEKVGRVEFTLESVPRYRDDEMKNVRLLYVTSLT